MDRWSHSSVETEHNNDCNADNLSFHSSSLPFESRTVGSHLYQQTANSRFVLGQEITHTSTSTATMATKVARPPSSSSAVTETTSNIPCRNLTEAFEELYVSDGTPASNGDDASTPATKPSLPENDDGPSPTGVADLDMAMNTKDNHEKVVQETEVSSNIPSVMGTPTAQVRSVAERVNSHEQIPQFKLCRDLQRDLSQGLVNRVSFYGVIHDINKEAVAMAANDTSEFATRQQQQQADSEEVNDEWSPLVIAVNGQPEDTSNQPKASVTAATSALIDEEQWLLSAISARNANVDETRSLNSCPLTFPQAMGERDYDSSSQSPIEGVRTQLWKPSRSWWEAKSGKNPWIEPKSHNKRWRYLWPLIHYHKFLAKCIKKLKRNGVDVKITVSPVSVFLREEVCAVSDHLASLSLFTSEQWMGCLEHFAGWTDPLQEGQLRELVSKLKLRSFSEPADVDSALLRSQIDTHFLRAMASAREQMENGGKTDDRSRNKSELPGKNLSTTHNQGGNLCKKETPPLPQYISAASPAVRAKHRKSAQKQPRRRAGLHNTDDSTGTGSINSYSTMTSEAFPQHYAPHQEFHGYGYFPGPYGYPASQYFPPPSPDSIPSSDCAYYYPPAPIGAYPDPAMYQMADPYHAQQAMAAAAGQGWPFNPQMGNPNMNVYNSAPSDGSYSAPPGFSPHAPHPYPGNEQLGNGDQTPYKHVSGNPPPQSPYWPNTIAGLMTPQDKHGCSPATPQRQNPSQGEDGSHPGDFNVPSDDSSSAMPQGGVSLTMNMHQPPYYHPYHRVDGYVPASPATQFMMAMSPHDPSTHQFRPLATIDAKGSMDCDDEHEEAEPRKVTPPPTIQKISNAESPSTVETTADSDSLIPQPEATTTH